MNFLKAASRWIMDSNPMGRVQKEIMAQLPKLNPHAMATDITAINFENIKKFGFE